MNSAKDVHNHKALLREFQEDLNGWTDNSYLKTQCGYAPQIEL